MRYGQRQLRNGTGYHQASSAPPTCRSDARATLSDIAGVTGQHVAWLPNDSKDANLRIHFTGERDFVINANEIAGCYAGTNSSEGRLVEADVYIGLEADGSIADCMTHEIMHAFGFHGHAQRPTSVLSSFAPTDDLAPWIAWRRPSTTATAARMPGAAAGPTSSSDWPARLRRSCDRVGRSPVAAACQPVAGCGAGALSGDNGEISEAESRLIFWPGIEDFASSFAKKLNGEEWTVGI
jgi:hypothetical protein